MQPETEKIEKVKGAPEEVPALAAESRAHDFADLGAIQR